MATAQVEAWVGTRKGAIPEAARAIDASLADAALGRMMLHRRRAVTASVISAFVARIGNQGRLGSEPGGHAVSLDAASERAVAARAAELVVALGPALPALTFERALLAADEGRFGDARSDLKQVVAVYPGFVPAAIAAGRLALASADSVEAIRALAAVEGEVTHTREGAALLADATRAIGLHESASRYDLAALLCRGGYDSHGNDCPPIDLTGKIVDDRRMPQALYLEGQADGSVICNAGGLYYDVNPFAGHLLSVVRRSDTFSIMRSLAPSAANRQRRALAGILAGATARAELFLGDRYPGAPVRLRRYALSAQSVSARVVAAAYRLAVGVDFAFLMFLYGLARRLPVRVRASANKTLQSVMASLRPLVRDTIAPRFGPRSSRRLFSPISASDAGGQLADARYDSGLARIFGLRPFANGTWVTPPAGGVREERLTKTAKPPPGAAQLKMPAPGSLSPRAEGVLRRLLSDRDSRRAAPPLS